METETRRQFKSRMDAKQDVWRAVPALMGNGSGTVEVPNQPGYVYIRTSANDLGQAFNNRCPLYDNLAIYCGYDPITDPDRRIFQVLSVRMTDYANAGNTPILNIPNHHGYHEFGGGDDVYVDWRRLLGFRVGRPVGFIVTVDQGVMMRAGAWTAIVAQTVNLAASQPGGINSARYVLVALDSTGTITTTNGAIVSAALLDISDCPVPVAGEIPLAAVRLYSSQTAISDTPGTPDIIDLRFPTTYTTGGSNVYGTGVANQFAYWTAADTLASSAEVIRQTNTCLVATKSVSALAPATYYTGLFSNATVTAAVAQAGHLIPVVVHLTAAGAADYTGDLVGYNGITYLTGTGTSSVVKGYDYTIQLSAAGTATEAACFYGGIDAGATGTVTTGYGLHVSAPLGSVGTFYGVHIATLAAATNKWAFYSVGDKITTKGAAAAGIELDPNAATGNFTLSLSPANLTGNRRHTLPNYNVTWPAADAVGVLTSNGAGVLSWGAAGGAHEILSATHTDTLADSVVDGDVIIGNVTPAWSRLAIAIPAANVRNALGIDNGELRPSWKTTLDATNPTTIGVADAGGPGTSLIYSHRDHQHPSPATWTAAAHNVLDSTYHGDVLTGAITRGDILYGNATPKIARLAKGGANAVLTGDGTDTAWSTYLLTGTAGGTTNFAVTNTKTLTLTATDSYNLTVPETGTAALLEAANVFTNNLIGRLGVSSKKDAAGGIQLFHNNVTGNLYVILQPGYNLTGTRYVSFPDANLTFSTGGTLSLGGYTLTVPATGTAALLGIANIFTAVQTVSLNAAALPAALTNTVVHIANADATETKLLLDAIGSNPSLTWRRADGTLPGSLSAVQSNDQLGNFLAYGYGATGYSAAARSYITTRASENWTDAAQGTLWQFATTITGGTTTAVRATITGLGNFLIGTATDFAAGPAHVKIAGGLSVGGDNSGVASHNSFTNVSDVSANSTGVGTIKFKGATNRDSTGFIKIYIGTTAYYVPVFSAITG